MDGTVLFEEVQRVSKKPVGDFFKALVVLFLVALGFNLIWQKGTVNQLTMALAAGFLIVALIAFFANMKMVTQIRADGIYVRYPPFEPDFKGYLWTDIEEVYIREFDAVGEYGGWGIRVGFSGVKYGGSGKAYIFSGNVGIQIVLSDHSRVLIGTARGDEIAGLLHQFNHNKGSI
jgi:hypothetical protein